MQRKHKNSNTSQDDLTSSSLSTSASSLQSYIYEIKVENFICPNESSNVVFKKPIITQFLPIHKAA